MVTEPAPPITMTLGVSPCTISLVSIDRGGVVVGWSPCASAMFGHDAGEAIGHSFEDFLLEPATPERRERLHQVFDDSEEMADLSAFVRLDGSVIHAAVTALPVLDADGRVARVDLLITAREAGPDDLHDSVRSRIDRIAAVHTLDAREVEVLRLLASGHRVATIAPRLHLARGTVRNLLSCLYVKLGVASQIEVIELLVGHGDGPRA